MKNRSAGPLRLLLQFMRVKEAGDLHAFHFEPQDYILPTAGGDSPTARFDWTPELLADLQAVRRPGRDPAVLRRIGERLRSFVKMAGWERYEQDIAQALDTHRPVFLTIRSSAAELYALPWELLTLKSGQRIGGTEGLLLRFEWPERPSIPEQPKPRPEGGRILVAWSAAGGAVPAAEHIKAIASACAKGFHPFDPATDVLADASLSRIAERLEAAQHAGSAIAVLHLLCHGSAAGSTFGLCLTGESGSGVVVDAAQVQEQLSPFASMVRLVVLSACDSGNLGKLGNHLGSVAQELHRAGYQSVLASRFPLSVAGSILLTESLYGELLSGPTSLETAFLAARKRLVRDETNLPGNERQLDWASIQLYSRHADGEDTRPLMFRPFRGLLAFQPEHRRFFFGRDPEIKEIVGDLQALIDHQKERFLVVAGASGTGKSSVVLAGAVPRLLEANPGLRFLRMRPGSDPERALNEALASWSPGTAALLVVDQFEEVFTHTVEPAIRNAFVRRMWSLAAAPEPGLRVLITLRVDFIGRCGEFIVNTDGLRLDRVAYDEQHRVFIAQLEPEQLRAAIVEPARKLGLELQAGLAERILDEVSGEPGALPLLEDALDTLWQRRDQNLLLQTAYDELGGVVGSLQKRADALLEKLPYKEDLAIAQRLLVSLVAVAEDTALDTRLRVPLADLRNQATEDEAAGFERVLKELVSARLLVQSDDGQAPTLEVAHEALIRRWPRLRAWLDEDRTGLLVKHRVKQAAQRWARDQRDASHLYRGGQLAQASEWRKTWESRLGDLEKQFLDASEALRVQTAEQEEMQHRRERERLELLTRVQELEKLFGGAPTSARPVRPARTGTRLYLTIELEFARAENTDDPFAFRFAPQDYLLRTQQEGFKRASLSWDNALLENLQAVRRPGGNPVAVARLGEALRLFLVPLGWNQISREILDATRQGKRVLLTIRSAAAELYALPWEMLPLVATGQAVGAHTGVLLRYEWPSTTTEPKRSERRPSGERILLAWSAAGGAVPAAEHLNAIQGACRAALYPFDPENDVLPNASLGKLSRALETAKKNNQPISVVHLLAQSQVSGNTFGLALNGASLDGEPKLVDGAQLRQLFGPHADMVRLVVLMVSDSGNSGALGNQLGSVAQQLHRTGIEAVIAARYPLSVAGSVCLSQTLYRRLITELDSLETALLEARNDLAQDGNDMDWASVLLYARAWDGNDTRPLAFRLYPGMAAFQVEDHRLFFGREELTAALWKTCQKLFVQREAAKLLAILGPSGAGKSSVARAGLLAELARNPFPEAPPLRIAAFRPGVHPLHALEAALSECQRDPSEDCILLLVDQFEEVYAHCADQRERDAFVERLLRDARTPGRPVFFVLTLRSDYLGETRQHHPELNSLIMDSAAWVGNLRQEELRAAIAKPAERVGRPMDEATVDLLLAEARGSEGALPFLAFVLASIWEGMLANQEPSTTLRELGGVGGVLAAKAQAVYDGLSTREEVIAQRALVRSFQSDAVGRNIRRRVPLRELCGRGDTAADILAVLRKFAAESARLVILSDDGQEVVVEVTHEALADRWMPLRKWLDESRADRFFYARVAAAEELWRNAGRLTGRLWRPPDLDLLHDYHMRKPEELSPLQTEFLSASEQQQQREKSLRWGFCAAVLVALVALVVAAGIYHSKARQRANNARQNIEMSCRAAWPFPKALRNADPFNSSCTKRFLKPIPFIRVCRFA